MGGGVDFGNYAVVASLVLLALLNLILMYYFEKEKISTALAKEGDLIKRYRFSIFTLSFFIILGILAYYLNSIGKMPKTAIYLYYLFLIIFLISIFIGRQISKKPETVFKKIENKPKKDEKISSEWWGMHLKKINAWLQQDVKFASKKDKSVLKDEKKISKKISLKNSVKTE